MLDLLSIDGVKAICCSISDLENLYCVILITMLSNYIMLTNTDKEVMWITYIRKIKIVKNHSF